MEWSGIRGLLRHELAQYAANKKQLASVVVGIPVLFAVFGILFAVGVAEQAHLDSPEPNSLEERFPGYSDEAVFLGGLGWVFLSIAMLLVCGVQPVTLGATAVVGEKNQRTLECLLLLPVSDREILLAKVAPAALLPLGVCWLCCGGVASVVFLLLGSQSLHSLLNREFAVAALLTAPAVATMSALGATISSALAGDTKAARDLCQIVILGIGAVFLALYVVFVIFEHRSVILITLCVLALDVLLFSIAVRLFNRERLLLKY